MTYMTSRAAQHCLAGRMRPAGRGLESPAIDDTGESVGWVARCRVQVAVGVKMFAK